MARGKEVRQPSIETLLRNKEITPILAPQMSILDLPHIAVIWGAFDPELYEENKRKLLQLSQGVWLNPEQRLTLSYLYQRNAARAERYMGGYASWKDVGANLADRLGIDGGIDSATMLQSPDLIRYLEGQIQQAEGDVVLFGPRHSYAFPAHMVVRDALKEDTNRLKIAEIVFDRHIDTGGSNYGRNEGIPTSADVYLFLTNGEYIECPVIIGPDSGLIDKYSAQGGDRLIKRIIVPDVVSWKNRDVRAKMMTQVVETLKNWGVTHITYSVDLDVLAESEGAFAVRYSPIMPYLGLGCQVLPEDPTKDDLIALRQLKYPTAQVRYLLEEEQIFRAQNLAYVRQMRNMSGLDGESMLTAEQMSTDIGQGEGLRVAEVLEFLQILKQLFLEYDLEEGLELRSGGRFFGTVVEACGFEDSRGATSEAAVKLAKAIAI